MEELYECPVCGNKTLDALRDHEICTVCNWEDDLVQFIKPDFKGGANKMSLNEAREAWANGKEVK